MNSKDFDALMRQRTSVHHFLSGHKISHDEYCAILNTVRYTPSGYNAQPWQFMLVQDDALLTQIRQVSYNQEHITTSGNIVLVLGNTEFMHCEEERILREWAEKGRSNQQIESLRAGLRKNRSVEQKQLMTLRATSMAAMSFLLAAEAAGWSTCPMMGFNQHVVRALLGIPEKYVFGLMIALGKKDTSKQEQGMPRKSVELINYNPARQTDA